MYTIFVYQFISVKLEKNKTIWYAIVHWLLCCVVLWSSHILIHRPLVKVLLQDFREGTVDKNLPANSGDMVQSLVQEDFTCLRKLKVVCHNSWALIPQLLKPTPLEPVFRHKRRQQWAAHALQLESSPSSQLEKALAQQRRFSATKNKFLKIKKKNFYYSSQLCIHKCLGEHNQDEDSKFGVVWGRENWNTTKIQNVKQDLRGHRKWQWISESWVDTELNLRSLFVG